MPQVERSELEREHSLREARCIASSFLNDDETYPDTEFLMRRGVGKLLADEYVPLVALASHLPCVRSLRLNPDSHPGPDAVLRFWLRPHWNIQITCAHEGADRALMREYMAKGTGIAGSGKYERDPVSKQVVFEQRGFSPAAEVQARITRIVDAVRQKEAKYYPGTQVLLIDEAPAGVTYFREHSYRERVVEAVRGIGESNYRRIYIVYGESVERIS